MTADVFFFFPYPHSIYTLILLRDNCRRTKAWVTTGGGWGVGRGGERGV